MPDELERTQQRTIQYFYVDGIFEACFGVLCLVLGFYFLIENRLQATRFGFLVDILLVFVVIGGAFLFRWFIRKWKNQVTFPRTGVVIYHRKYGPKRGWMFLVGLVISGAFAAATVYLLSQEDIHLAVMPLLTGGIFGIVMFFVGWRTSMRRFTIQALISVLAGLGLAFSGLGNYIGLAIYYLAIGLGLFTSGACFLRKYLRQNPLPSVEASDDR